MSEPVIRAAAGRGDLDAVSAMILDYAAACGFSLCFDGLGEEVAGLPGAYAPPDGRLLIADLDGTAAGCIGLRRLADGSGELKRLYVCPAYRGQGIGRSLCQAIIAEAVALGYRVLRLDTRWDMAEAKALYGTLGFVPIPAYYDGAEDGVEFFERHLEAGAQAV